MNTTKQSFKFVVLSSKLLNVFKPASWFENIIHSKFKIQNPEFGKRQRLSQRGFSLVEVLLAVAIMGIITPAIVSLLAKTRQAFAADEIHMQLRGCNEQTLNRLHVRLSANKRIFQGDANGQAFLSRVQIMGSAPPVLGGSKLPMVMATSSGSLSPNSPGFTPGNIGNSLFFLAFDSPQTYALSGAVTVFNAPATITTTNSGGATLTVVMDLYRFYYYYLSANNPHAVPNAPTYSLVEWQSGQYADYSEINAIGDFTLMSNVSQALLSQGVSNAIDPTQAAVTLAFTNINSTGYPTLNAGLTITQYWTSNLTRLPFGSGILSSGFFYGIAPNTPLWGALGGPSSAKVPLYASAAGSFPGGLEIGLSGTTAGREIMVRSVLAAKGAVPQVESDDMNTVIEARDEWGF